MRFLTLVLVAGALVMSAATVSKADDDRKLVTVVTSPEPQTQLMAMVLTMQAVQAGAKGHVLLCGPAGDIALKEAPASATTPQQPKGMSPQGLMRQIMAKTGTPVEVCALYLPNKGFGADKLLDGVTVARPPEMAARLMGDDTRVLSF